MIPDMLFHIPGTHGMFDYDELKRRTELPRRLPTGEPNPEYIRPPAVVELKDAKRGHPMGRMAWSIAAAKFQ